MVAKVTILIPPAELMDAFLEQAAASEKQMLLLESANGRAAEARDLRCLRLMSGEIEVWMIHESVRDARGCECSCVAAWCFGRKTMKTN